MRFRISNFLLKSIILLLVSLSLATAAMKFEIPKDLQDEYEAMKAAEAEEDEGPMTFGVVDENPESSNGSSTETTATPTDDEAIAVFEVKEEPIAEGAGRLSGQVFDKDSGDTLRGVAILIEDTDLGTISDSQGRYRISNVPSGEYTVSYIKTGYIEASVTGAVVEVGQTKKLDFALPPRPIEMSDEVYELQDFTVSAEEVTSQNVALLALRQQSIASVDALSSEDFAKFAAGDAAEAVSKISGASVSDGKYIVLRGLNDRYNTTLINGVRLPSPDPDRKAVPLDIFPTSLFESIIARKTFTSDQPGESSGGSIELRTKSIPEDPFFKISYGTGYQRDTKGEFILSDPERATFGDWLKGDDRRGFTNEEGGRAIVSDYENRVGDSNFPLMTPVARKAPYDQSFSFSMGGSHALDDWISVGAIFGTKFSSKNRSKVTEVNRSNITNGVQVYDDAGEKLEGSEEFTAAYLLGLGAELGERVSLNYTYLRSENVSTSASEYRYQLYDSSLPGLVETYDSSIKVEDRLLEAHQFGGQVRFNLLAEDEWTFDWYFTNAYMSQVEPDQRLVDGLEVGIDGEFIDPGAISPNYALRFQRETEQDSSILGGELSSPEFKLGKHVTFSLSLGASEEESLREFTQLETASGQINQQSFLVGNPLYAGIPVPDASGLRPPFENYFEEYFREDFFGVDAIIDQIYTNEIQDLNQQVASRTTTFNNRLATLNTASASLNAAQTSLSNAISQFEAITLVDFETQYDPNNPLQLILFQNLILPNQNQVDTNQAVVDTAQANFDAINTEVSGLNSDLNTLTNEQLEYQASALALFNQIASMPALASDASAFPTYSYLGDANYILETPAGFTLYADSTPASNRSIFENSQFKYLAEGKEKVSSLFVSGEFGLFDRVRIAGGIRHEKTELSYELRDVLPGEPPPGTRAIGDGFNPVVVEPSIIDQRDELPFISTIIDITDNLKLQFSFSKTIAKPTFREIAPFPIYNLSDGSIEIGNPGLTKITDSDVSGFLLPEEFAGLNIADVESRDVKLEWYTPLDGLISIGYFEKDVSNPIERIQAFQINGVDISSYINNDNSAELNGWEFELRQNLGFIDEDLFRIPFSWVTVGGNYTYLDAFVERSSFEKDNLTNTRFNNQLIDPLVFQDGELSTRPLFDQPEYVANAYVTFNIKPTNTTLTLSQNWVGPQLLRAGGLNADNRGTADLYWASFSSVNLVVEQKLSEHWTLVLSAKNIDRPDRKTYEDPFWYNALNDSTRYLDENAFPADAISSSNSRTSQFIEPSYSISIKGSF